MRKLDLVKAWHSSHIQEFRGWLKTDGWKIATFGAPLVMGTTFVACEVEKVEVETEQIDSLTQIENMLGDKFSVAALVEEQAKQKFGDSLVSLACQNANGTGKVVAIFVEDGILKKATTELDLTAKDFDGKIYEYNTYLKEGNTLSFYQNGQEQEVDLSKPGIVSIPQADGSLAVLDTTKAEEKIENAILSVQQTEFDLQTDLDEVSKQDFKTLLGFVIEKDQTAHLPTLKLEYDRAKDQTTATYSYLSLGQEKKIEGGSIVFEGDVTANGNLDRTAAEEQLQAEKATISKKTPTVIEQSDFTKLYQVENFDTNSVELEVAEKESGGETGQDEPELEPITFDSWQKVFELENGKVKDAIVKTLQDNLLTETMVKRIYGNSMTVADLLNGTIDLLKWGFDLQDGKIVSVNILGVRKGYPTEQSRRLRGANFALKQPISLESVVAEPVKDGSAYNQNSISLDINNAEYLIDLSQIELASQDSSYSLAFGYDAAAEISDQEDLDFFKLCMPLAVAAGKIGQESKLSFVSVQGSSGTTSDFGSVYDVVIKAVDLSNDQLYNFEFIFDDARTSYKPIIEEIKRAISDGQFRISDRGVKKILPEIDIVLEYPSDITEYSIPAQEKEKAN